MSDMSRESASKPFPGLAEVDVVAVVREKHWSVKYISYIKVELLAHCYTSSGDHLSNRDITFTFHGSRITWMVVYT